MSSRGSQGRPAIALPNSSCALSARAAKTTAAKPTSTPPPQNTSRRCHPSRESHRRRVRRYAAIAMGRGAFSGNCVRRDGADVDAP
ncbi:hypothetical protein AZA_83561 [Nitrospirillum viridazoti Y2]|nr:hypothetical protein AZA_83561 [Nitrospirillum amazonense Y2]